MKISPTVKLVNFTTGALELLIYTKSGRLKTGTALQEITDWDMEKKLEHLSYMMDTIKTSFEFVDYVFRIERVSKDFTHQLVRTRTASFQQESHRTVDARENTYLLSSDHDLYEKSIQQSISRYAAMIDLGEPVQDARGVLPTAMHTSIFIKANLRTLSQMAELRLCCRAGGEYQRVFKMMVTGVLNIHPWASPLLQVYCIKYGICAFPRYDKCPVQQFCLKPEVVRPSITEAWKAMDHVANPVVNKNGMTM